MSKITFTDDAGNAQDLTLPDGITLTIAPPTSLVADFEIVRVDGLAVAVRDTSKVVGGTIESIYYVFAPKVSSSGRPGSNASAMMPAAGTYAIKQTVRDSNGHVEVATHSVTVGDPASNPPADPPPSDPPPVSPPPPPPASAFTLQVMEPSALPDALVQGTVNGIAVNLTVKPGQRVPTIKNADGSYAFMHGAICYYPDGSIVPENSYVGRGNPTPADADIDLTITVGDKVFKTGAVTLWDGSWTRPFWINAPVAKPLTSALRAIFPYYRKGSEHASRVAAVAAAGHGILSVNTWDPHMFATGEHDDLGLLDATSACALVNPSDEAYAAVRELGDASAPFPFHAVSTETNRMLLASESPTVSWQGSLRKNYPNNPYRPAKPSSCNYSLNQGPAHAPAFNALACALFGRTMYDQASLAQWANFIAVLFWNWVSRIPNGPVSINHGAGARAPAWVLRSLVQAAKLCDPEDAALFDGYAKAQLAEMATVFGKQKANGHMPMVMPLVCYPTNSTATGYQYSNFEMCFLGSSLGYALQNGYTEAQEPFDLISECTIDSLTKYPHEIATKYAVSYYDTNRKAAANYGECLQFEVQHHPAFAKVLACAEGSMEMQQAIYAPNPVPGTVVAGDFIGYPESANGSGYSAVLMSHTAYLPAYATDKAGGTAAHAKVLENMHESFATNPKYNIDTPPRAA